MPQQNPAIQLDAEEQQLNPWGNPNAAWGGPGNGPKGSAHQHPPLQRRSPGNPHAGPAGGCPLSDPDQQRVAQIRKRHPPRATGHPGSSLNLEGTSSFQTPADPGSMAMFRARAMAATPIAELLQLPRRERLALAMALWESLDEVGRSESLPMDRELGEELDRRWTAHLQNPTAAISWDEVRNQLGLG